MYLQRAGSGAAVHAQHSVGNSSRLVSQLWLLWAVASTLLSCIESCRQVQVPLQCIDEGCLGLCFVGLAVETDTLGVALPSRRLVCRQMHLSAMLRCGKNGICKLCACQQECKDGAIQRCLSDHHQGVSTVAAAAVELLVVLFAVTQRPGQALQPCPYAAMHKQKSLPGTSVNS